MTQQSAAARVGLDHRSLCRALAHPAAREFVDSRTRSHIEQGKPIAAARLLQLVTDAKSEHVRLAATELTLGLNSLAPAADSRGGVNISIHNGVEICAGYVVDLSPHVPVGAAERARLVEQISDSGGVVREESPQLSALGDTAWQLDERGRPKNKSTRAASSRSAHSRESGDERSAIPAGRLAMQ